MTSFVKILQNIQGNPEEEKIFMNRLNDARLLIIDDLGTERNTEYALEKVYNIIDSRYRAGKPLILTTNMTIKEMVLHTSLPEHTLSGYPGLFGMSAGVLHAIYHLSDCCFSDALCVP